MPLHGTMFVDCPCCGARIEVDRESGKLIEHWTKQERPKGDPLQAAVEKLKTDQAKLENWFSTAQGQMEAQKKKARERFEAEARRIAREGDTSRPPNPMDD
ncbi:MAG: hypothetical protein NTX64_07670 [Elusimicrobia bacterium]|nr:hypothetical protein [Elusimicrobiota bacterium]